LKDLAIEKIRVREIFGNSERRNLAAVGCKQEVHVLCSPQIRAGRHVLVLRPLFVKLNFIRISTAHNPCNCVADPATFALYLGTRDLLDQLLRTHINVHIRG
jgi:hypothetical protein